MAGPSKYIFTPSQQQNIARILKQATQSIASETGLDLSLSQLDFKVRTSTQRPQTLSGTPIDASDLAMVSFYEENSTVSSHDMLFNEPIASGPSDRTPKEQMSDAVSALRRPRTPPAAEQPQAAIPQPDILQTGAEDTSIQTSPTPEPHNAPAPIVETQGAAVPVQQDTPAPQQSMSKEQRRAARQERREKETPEQRSQRHAERRARKEAEKAAKPQTPPIPEPKPEAPPVASKPAQPLAPVLKKHSPEPPKSAQKELGARKKVQISDPESDESTEDKAARAQRRAERKATEQAAKQALPAEPLRPAASGLVFPSSEKKKQAPPPPPRRPAAPADGARKPEIQTSGAIEIPIMPIIPGETAPYAINPTKWAALTKSRQMTIVTMRDNMEKALAQHAATASPALKAARVMQMQVSLKFIKEKVNS